MAATESNSIRTWNDKFTKINSYFINEDGAAPAISEKYTPGGPFRLKGLRVVSDGNVTTSENFTITMDINAGATFDHVAYSKDLSTVLGSGGFYEYLFDPHKEYAQGDAFTVAFANTEANNIAIEILVEEKY